MTDPADLRHEPAHFNTVAYANIPESWTIYPHDGNQPLHCDSLEDARAVAERFGYTLWLVGSLTVTPEPK